VGAAASSSASARNRTPPGSSRTPGQHTHTLHVWAPHGRASLHCRRKGVYKDQRRAVWKLSSARLGRGRDQQETTRTLGGGHSHPRVQLALRRRLQEVRVGGRVQAKDVRALWERSVSGAVAVRALPGASTGIGASTGTAPASGLPSCPASAGRDLRLTCSICSMCTSCSTRTAPRCIAISSSSSALDSYT
jgi:hypothetical protein